MSQGIAQKWLSEVSKTANALDYEGHMDLISKRVALYGVPGFEVITYDGWAEQCKHEFTNKILKSVNYEGFKLIDETPRKIVFKTFETIEGTDGTINAQGIEVVLEKEQDGKWRLIQERVLLDDETTQDNLLPTSH